MKSSDCSKMITAKINQSAKWLVSYKIIKKLITIKIIIKPQYCIAKIENLKHVCQMCHVVQISMACKKKLIQFL